MSNEHTPELGDAREAWIYWQSCASLQPSAESGAEFDRAIAKIKVDAVRDFLDYFETWEMVEERVDRYIKRIEDQL